MQVTVSSVQGMREYQEDRVIYKDGFVAGYAVAAVFDGHVGDAASEYMINNLVSVLKTEMKKSSQMQKVLFNTVKTLEFSYSGKGYSSVNDKGYSERLKELPNIPGTTAVICLIDKKNKVLYVANVGDSRAIIARGGKVYQITADHSMHIIGPETHRLFERDKSAFIKEGYLWTTTGEVGEDYGLNVIRTLGDPLFKGRFNPIVLQSKDDYDIIGWHPDLFCYQLKKGDVLVLGSDGVYNFISNAETARAALKGGAEMVTKTALKEGSNDNISAIVIKV